MRKFEGIFTEYKEMRNRFKDKVGVVGRIQEAKRVISGDFSLSYPLSKLIDFVNSKKKSVVVHDVGGAAGSDYFRVLPYIRNSELKWRVYELPEVVFDYMSFLNAYNNIKIYNIKKLKLTKGINIFYSKGTIQYLEDPRMMLEFASKCDAVFLHNLLASPDIPTFLTYQKEVAPSWCLNSEEVDSFFKGFRYYDMGLADEHGMDMSALPELFHFKKMRNVVAIK